MIVVSSDWREFDLASYFLRGQALASAAVIALPHDRAVFPLWRTLPVPGVPYATVDDIVSMVDTHRADFVFLFSAYLFGKDGLFLPDSLSLDALLDRLRRRGCQVVTSDPLLGLGRNLPLDQIHPSMLAPHQPTVKRGLLRAFVRWERRKRTLVPVPRLDGVPHVYPSAAGDHSTGLAFFNPVILKDDVARTADRAPQQPGLNARPGWLFLLSEADFHVQQQLLGLGELIERLLGMLRHAVENEARPTLIAPPSITTRMANAVPHGAELLSSCPTAQLQQRLLDAEYTFHWSLFSTALLTRVANELPVFLFDRGQYARAIEPYYERAVAWYFGGWEPTALDPRQVFSDYVLGHLAKAQKPALRALSDKLRSLPSPDALVDRLMDGRAGTNSA